MATKLFLRNTQDNGKGATYFDMVTTAGSAAATAVVNTVASGTEIQWTQTAGGAVIQWISGRAPVGGFTLTTTDISIWALESNVAANSGGRFRVFKRTAAGVETELAGGPFNDGVEFTASNAEYLWVGNVTDTAFAENDRILLKVYITNVGTMGGSRTCTLTYNAANAATGDSFFNIAETITFKAESDTTTITPPQGNLALSSAAPAVGVTANTAITTPQGNVALSTLAPSVLVTANVTVSPASGNLALSAVAPTVTANHLRQPNAAQALLNNWIVDENGDPILDENDDPILDAAANAPIAVATTGTNDVEIEPASANLVLSGSAPTVAAEANTFRSPAAGQLLLNNWILDETGDPVLDENSDPVLDAAANSPTAVVTANAAIFPATADLVLSSVAPSAFVAFTISPAAADLVLSTAAPTLSAALVIAPAATDLVLTTAAPTVAASDHLSASPDAADLVLSTAAPTVAANASVSIVPPFAELVLSSTIPAVAATAHESIAPAGADLVLSALAPTVVVAPATVAFSPAAAQALLNNWIVDEVGDPVLDENGDPILDAAANAPSVSQTNNVAVSPAAGDLLLSSVAPSVAATGQDTVVSPASADLTLSSAAPSVVVAFPALEVVGGGGGPLPRRRLPRKPPRRVIQRPPPVPVPVSLVPPFANLVLSSTAPTAFVTDHLSATPAAADLGISLTAPVIGQTDDENITPEELLLIAEAA